MKLLMKLREFVKVRREIAAGSRCNLCGEKYVGLALDCRCTNYGMPRNA